MKRSPLARGDKQLQRRSEMPRGKGIKPGSKALARAAAKRSASRPRTAPASVVDLVKDRSGGFCEIGLLCLGRAQATERAHRMGKGTGGAGSKGRKVSDSASNLLDACRQDHDLIDRASVAESYVHGYKIRHGIALPHEMPVQHFTHGWVLLDDNGGWAPAPTAAIHPTGLVPVVTITARERDYVIDGVVAEAMDRFGHRGCGGWTYEPGQVLRCDCGADLFVVEVTS